MNFQLLLIVLILAGALVGPVSAAAKSKPEVDCTSYFVVVEHDEETSNLNMIGLNHPQREWYEKHGAKEAPGICAVNGSSNGERVTVEMADEKSMLGNVGAAPLYSIAWEEHQVFVPDNKGGHYAYKATGILSLWTPSANNGQGDFVPVGPIHNTNRTILTSSSVSLLKDALHQIASRR